MSRPRSRPTAKPPPAKTKRIRECRRVRKIGRIHYAELLALLALFKGGCHGRFVHFFQQGVVELQSRLMVAGDLLVLLPRPAGSTESSPRRCEPAVRSELCSCFAAAMAACAARSCALSCSSCGGSGRLRRMPPRVPGQLAAAERACDLCLQIGNLARDRDHIGMVGRVLRLQRLLLLDQSPELVFCAHPLKRPPATARYFANRAFAARPSPGEKSHPAGAAQRLGRGVKLGCECLKRVRIRPLLGREACRNTFARRLRVWRPDRQVWPLQSASRCFRKSVVPSADCSRAFRFSLTKSDVISPHTCCAVRASCALNVIKKPGIPPTCQRGLA